MTTLNCRTACLSQPTDRLKMTTLDIENVNVSAFDPMPSPEDIHAHLPLSASAAKTVMQGREILRNILDRKDHRLFIVVGPCSIHDPVGGLDYARRLKALSDEVGDTLCLIMRVYFEKPRTTTGWKGYINDPRLDGSFRINEGLRRARELLLEISAMGLPAGTEFLDLLSPQYISDLIAWGAIGARTTESQSHRQLASGLSCPVGFKNGTDGGVQVAADALRAAAAPHAFMGMTKMGVAAIFETRGNPDGHVILRGGRTPNFDAAGVEAACAALRAAGLREQVMVDCSHANSAKQYRRQVEVAADLARQISGGERRIVGVMVESHLNEGRQDLIEGRALAPGVSITDACIGWDDTVPVLRELAAAVRERRKAA